MKNNNTGFTLIELLAVITIMGILMMVAIPTISRTIENARKDTFIDMVQQYVNAVKSMWAGDNLMCGNYTSSAVQAGAYYVEVDTTSESVPQLLEQGGKSPWGNRDVKGIIGIAVWINDDTRTVTYFPALVDGIHGVNVKPDGSGTVSSWKSSKNIKRGDLVMTNAKYSAVATSETGPIKSTWRFTMDINTDGDKSDVVDGLEEGGHVATKCVER